MRETAPEHQSSDATKHPPIKPGKTVSKWQNRLTILMIVIMLLVYTYKALFTLLGSIIIADDPPVAADAVVVLNSGVEYYPRLMEAARLYRDGLAPHVVINGNRKTDTIRQLETMGYAPLCRWHDNSVQILTLLGVPEDDITPISAEDAYDTMSEADAVGPELIAGNFKIITITTSKYHTRRARHIWRDLYGEQLDIKMVAAKDDPYQPDGWWREGRQIRWVLAEYGAWVFYYWKKVFGFSK